MEGRVNSVSPVKVKEYWTEAHNNPVNRNEPGGNEEGQISETIKDGSNHWVNEHPEEEPAKNDEHVQAGQVRETIGCFRTEDAVVDRTIDQRTRLELINH